MAELSDAQRKRIRIILIDVRDQLVDVEEGLDHVEQAIADDLGEPYADEGAPE